MNNQQKIVHMRYGIWMRLALITTSILLISATCLAMNRTAASDDNSNEVRKGLQWRYNSASQTNWISEVEYHDYFDKAVSRITNAYYELDAKDQDDYTRLLLLCCGIVGIIGMRRTVKKEVER